MVTSPPAQISTGPVTRTERIVSIDVLRGVAVLAILVMNIQSFSMIGAAYMNPTAYGDLTGVNYAVWLLSHVLADQKFMAIFSMLFGAGILLMSSRREAAGRPAAGVHYRRMGLLLVFGLLHAYLLWFGDILYAYAMCGFVVYLLRRRRPTTLLVIGLLAIAFASAVSVFFAWSMPHWPPEAVENLLTFWAPQKQAVADELTVYRGSWFGQLPYRMTTAVFLQTFVFITAYGWRTAGLMLVGMALFKLQVFSAKRSTATYLAMIAAGVFLGVPIILYGVHRNSTADWDVQYSMFLGSQFNYWGSILVAMGWVGLVMLVCKRGKTQERTCPLAAVGQMALTNYLLQTIICTTIFYGHGLGLFGKMERLGQIGVVLTVWVFLLVISPLWLRYFRFGPCEWLWRSLTYMKAQPMYRA